MRSSIYVYAGWKKTVPLIGIYSYDRQAGTAMFQYDADWIDAEGPVLGPDLPLTSGWQYLDKSSGKDTFGFISDASPDRWGRGLVRRKEHYIAKEENRKPRALRAEDYLLGVSDRGRSGGLRFKAAEDGPFLSEENEIPKMASLRSVQQAVYQYTDPDISDNERWLKDIFVPGSSLGGARPKANVYDTAGNLWIAKFPVRRDDTDIGAWEMAVTYLAGKCGIAAPGTQIISLPERKHIFLSRRFDRRGEERIHMMSAMTALDARDGGDTRSFLELAEYISENSCRPEEDLKELFRRIAFFICISNTDCHLRNHAFLLSENGWNLSPAYDMNPSVEKDRLALNITDAEADIDLRLLLETAAFYRYQGEEAKAEIAKVQEVVSGWKLAARHFQIPEKEMEMMAPAFSETMRKL